MARARATSPEAMVVERSQCWSSARSPSESAMLKLSLRPRIRAPLSATAPNHASCSLFSQFRYPILRSCTKRLQRLIANLLVLARPEQENPTPEEPLDFYHLVRTTINEHRKGCPHRQIRLTAQETEILVAAHPDYTEEVFINLLSNAEKYSPPEEPIEVRLRRAGDHVEASVLDRGPGIAADEVHAIFQPFYRSPITSSKVLGLGLGLSVCKRLIEIQGGHIWVAPREGGGSEFAFALPLSRELSIC